MEDQREVPSKSSTAARMPCPEESVWVEVAAGLTKPAEVERLTAHAAGCETCAALLKDAIFAIGGDAAPEEFDEKLTVMSARGPSELARNMASPQGRRGPWLLLAAGLALVLGGGAIFGLWRMNRASEPLDLLARAYESRRTIELGIPGAGHGPMRVERGGGSDGPVELFEAQALIRRRLDKSPEDPGAWHAKGRAELLQWRFNDAVQSFQAAADLGEDGPEFLVDFATAYFERAEQNKEPVDYTQSVELLSKALRKRPDFAVALYNRAIVYSKLMLVNPAIDDFERFIAIAKDAGWKAEAEQRLAEVRQRKSGLLDPRGVPPEELRVETEFEEALRAGLKGVRPGLAREMRERHGDRWLEDALAVRGLQPTATALLGEMAGIRSRLAMQQYNAAKLQTLKSLFLPQPLAVWRDFELLFQASHGKTLDACPNAMSPGSYPWFQVQTLLETSTCDLGRHNLDAAGRHTREAISTATKAALAISEIRASGFQSSHLINEGRYREAAQVDTSALERLSKGGFPLTRVNQFFNDWLRLSERLDRWSTAAAAARMNAYVANQLQWKLPELVAMGQWAAMLRAAGDPEAANVEASALRLVEDAASSQANAIEPAYARVGIFESKGDADGLAKLRSEPGISANPFLEGPLLLASARLAMRQGKHGEAERLTKELLLRKTKPADSESRLRWRREMSDAAGLKTEARLAQGDYDGAFQSWQEGIAVDQWILGGRGEASQSQPCNGCSVITFASLGDRIGVWTTSGGSRHFHWADASSAAILRTARRLRRQCSNPKVQRQSIDGTLSELKAQLFDGRRGAATGALYLQADGALGSLPLALTFEQEAAFGFPRIDGGRNRSAVAALGSDVAQEFRTLLPPLAASLEEVASVRNAFADVRAFEGQHATRRAIQSQRADVLHFAGHAIPWRNGIALLTAPNTGAADGEERLGIWRVRGPLPYRLAVFSACSTGSYEDQDTVAPRRLAEAALLAGAEGVVASLWDVDSAATAKFMGAFYGRLRQGLPPGAALRAAADWLRLQKGFEHPYYWAPFVLYGKAA